MLTPAKPKKRKNITIKSEDVNDLGSLMICAVRYAIGRESYMPGLVQGFIRRYPEAVGANVKDAILREIRECDRITEHQLPNGEVMKLDGLGSTLIDRPGWLKFEEWLKELEVE